MIQVQGQTIEVQFRQWDLPSYEVFLKTKKLPEQTLEYDWETDTYRIKTPARFAHILGVKTSAIDHGFLPLSPHLKDFQAFASKTALRCKRYAVWADTGLGKSHILLEYARQVQHRTGGKVLIISPLNIIPQTIELAAEWFGLEIRQLSEKQALKTWCMDGSSDIGIVNPEKFIPRKGDPEAMSEIRYCAGVVLDEAGLLRANAGKVKWSIIKSCRGIEYKLACTATPAPNNTMEYASQGSFLEKLRSEGEILWKFFAKDKGGNWTVKKHAEDAFYRFMASWSIYIRDPRHYGFDDYLRGLPDPVIREYALGMTSEQRAFLVDSIDRQTQMSLVPDIEKLPMPKRQRYSQVAKGFVYTSNGPERIESLKPAFVADLVRQDVSKGLQTLVWTVFDEESVVLAELLKGVGANVLTGKTPEKARIAMIEDFRKGRSDVLISKASLIGYGLNFQNCGSMVFSGFNDSMEEMYQAMRRAYRYGQDKAVRVHIPFIPELEGVVWQNVKKKQDRFLREIAIQEGAYREAIREVLGG